jgi:uncharacterized protein YqfA (UPF0365 family)
LSILFSFYFVPLGLFIRLTSPGKVKIVRDLIGMRLRKVPPVLIVRNMITVTKAGLTVDQAKLEAHYLAGGNVTKVINALISADKANLGLTFERATAIDLAGRDVLEAAKCLLCLK